MSGSRSLSSLWLSLTSKSHSFCHHIACQSDPEGGSPQLGRARAGVGPAARLPGLHLPPTGLLTHRGGFLMECCAP